MRLIFFVLLIATAQAGAQDLNPERAQRNYMINCQGCHLPDGSGLAGSVPSMRNFVGNFLGVKGGREFLIQVPGSANSPLDDAALAELLNWILLNMSPGQIPPGFQPYTADEVSAVRYKKLLDVASVRASLVAGFPDPASL